MVFQMPMESFDPRCTLGDGIGESLRNMGISCTETRRKVEELLERYGLEKEYADRYPQIVKERIEGGANEKAVWRLFINCPFVCINFDFFWLNKARQLYMDF